MNPNFAFPRRRRPHPLPSSSSSSSSSRESNALRASVLDAALLLGIGTNSTVTNWMFNNTTQEEDENDLDSELNFSPGLTSASTVTSEESFLSSPHTPLLPLLESVSKPVPFLPLAFTTVDIPDSLHTPTPTPRPSTAPTLTPSNRISTTPSPLDSSSLNFPWDKSHKLKKRRPTDEYESDGGIISGGRNNGIGTPKSSSKESVVSSVGRRSREEGDNRKSNPKKSFEDRGYDTDSASTPKSKRKQKNGLQNGFETDHQPVAAAKPKKSRSFFRLTSKASKLLQQQAPPVPSGPPVLPPPFIPELFPGSKSKPEHTPPPLRAPTPVTVQSPSPSTMAPTLALPALPAPITLPRFTSRTPPPRTTTTTPPPPPPITPITARAISPPSTSPLSRNGTIDSVSTASDDSKSTKSSRRHGLHINASLADTSDSISSGGHSSAFYTSSSHHQDSAPLPPPLPSTTPPPPNTDNMPATALPTVRPLTPRKRPPHLLNIPPIITTDPSARPGPASTPELVLPPPLPSPSSTIVPSSAFIVPSPRSSILGNYDIPPPSPPPTGPLPPPPSATSSSTLSVPSSRRQPTLQPYAPGQRERSPLAGPGTTLAPRGRTGGGGNGASRSQSPGWIGLYKNGSGPASAPPVQAPRLPLSASVGAVPGRRTPPVSAPVVRGKSPRPVMRGPSPVLLSASKVGNGGVFSRSATTPPPSGLVKKSSERGKEPPFPLRSTGVVSKSIPKSMAVGRSAPATVLTFPALPSSGPARVRTPVQMPNSAGGERVFKFPAERVPPIFSRDSEEEEEDSEDDLVGMYAGEDDDGDDGQGDEIQEVLDVLGRFADFGAVRRATGGVPIDVNGERGGRDSDGSVTLFVDDERLRLERKDSKKSYTGSLKRNGREDEADEDDTTDLRGELEARLNRSSGYDWASVMDGERSREARARLVGRVAAMVDQDEYLGSSTGATSRRAVPVRF